MPEAKVKKVIHFDFHGAAHALHGRRRQQDWPRPVELSGQGALDSCELVGVSKAGCSSGWWSSNGGSTGHHRPVQASPGILENFRLERPPTAQTEPHYDHATSLTRSLPPWPSPIRLARQVK